MTDESERLNNAVKARFAQGLNEHARLCPVCILRGPNACEVGRILYLCAENGIHAPRAQKGEETP